MAFVSPSHLKVFDFKLFTPVSDDGQRFDYCFKMYHSPFPWDYPQLMSINNIMRILFFQNPELAAHILLHFLSFVFKRKLLFTAGEEEKE